MNTCTLSTFKRRGFAESGFTLIELMITVVIIGILATIALPSYQQYVIRGNRASAQAEMMDLANRQQQFFLANRMYAGSLAAIGYAIPADLSTRYAAGIAANNAATPPEFTITFTAQGSQTTDGNLTLNSEGARLPADKW